MMMTTNRSAPPERSAEIENDVEAAPPALGSGFGLTHQEEPVDEIGCENEPTDAEPRAQGHVAIFALSGQAARLGQCSGMTAAVLRAAEELRRDPAARDHQDDARAGTGSHDQKRRRVVPQIRLRGKKASERGSAPERRGCLLVEVDSPSEGTADYSERELETPWPSDRDPDRGSNRRERANECERVAPGRNRRDTIRPGPPVEPLAMETRD